MINDFHKKRLRNKGALIGAGIGAIAGGAGNYFRKDKDKRSAKDALIGAAGGAGVGGLAGGVGGHLRGSKDVVHHDTFTQDHANLERKYNRDGSHEYNQESDKMTTDFMRNHSGVAKRVMKSERDREGMIFNKVVDSVRKGRIGYEQ